MTEEVAEQNKIDAKVGLSDLSDLLGCPFCGHKPDMSDSDTLHPAGIYWVEDDTEDDTIDRVYIGRQHDRFAESPTECWKMNCVEVAGGCGASIIGDDKVDAVSRWQRRAT